MASWKSKLLGNIGFRFRIQHKGAPKPWDDFIGRLRNYNDRFENCNVPARWKEDLALGQWVVNLRANRDKFSAENVRQLNELGFDWAPIKSQWSQRVRQLRAFKNQHGHCIVPKSDFDLWQWVANVRSRKTKLSSARIRALDRLEFDWTPYDTQWQRRYNELAEFRTRFGHANVPARWPENKALGLWLSDQRAGKESLSQECVRLLDELGVDWDPAGSTWMRHLEELRAFQVNHGHASPLVKSGPLGRWVEAQRALEQKLPEDRKRLLNELGFVWRRYRIKSQKNSPVVLDSPNRRCALAELPPENHPLPEIRIPFQTFDRGDSHTVVQCDIQDRAVSAV